MILHVGPGKQFNTTAYASVENLIAELNGSCCMNEADGIILDDVISRYEDGHSLISFAATRIKSGGKLTIKDISLLSTADFLVGGSVTYEVASKVLTDRKCFPSAGSCAAPGFKIWSQKLDGLSFIKVMIKE